MAFFGNWFKANRKKEQEDAYNEAMEQLRIQDEAQRQAAIERRKWYEDIRRMAAAPGFDPRLWDDAARFHWEKNIEIPKIHDFKEGDLVTCKHLRGIFKVAMIYEGSHQVMLEEFPGNYRLIESAEDLKLLNVENE
jgi:hypothetical protein